MDALPHVTAEDIWMNAGPRARFGFPLPSGHIPLPLPLQPGTETVCLTTTQEWESYQDLRSFTERTPD
jgi:hypothetical protein